MNIIKSLDSKRDKPQLLLHKKLTVSDFDLYNVVSMRESGTHLLEIDANSPGLNSRGYDFFNELNNSRNLT